MVEHRAGLDNGADKTYRSRLADSVSNANSVSNAEDVQVLIVDDEKIVRNLLQLSLQRMGYTVTCATDGPEALAAFIQQKYDLVLLDILMPGVDGFEVCAQLRRISAVPIVMLTALNRPDDIVRGLELGADTYITKPFTFKEVEARIRAILRRANGRTESEFVQVLEHGDVKLDTALRAVTVAGSFVELTGTEYRLLHRLMTNTERPISKEELLQTVWGYSASETDSNIVELAVRRLRKKVEEDPSDPQRLVTVRGVGYKFCAIDPNSRRLPAAAGPQHRRPATAEHWGDREEVDLDPEAEPESVG